MHITTRRCITTAPTHYDGIEQFNMEDMADYPAKSARAPREILGRTRRRRLGLFGSWAWAPRASCTRTMVWRGVLRRRAPRPAQVHRQPSSPSWGMSRRPRLPSRRGRARFLMFNFTLLAPSWVWQITPRRHCGSRHHRWKVDDATADAQRESDKGPTGRRLRALAADGDEMSQPLARPTVGLEELMLSARPPYAEALRRLFSYLLFGEKACYLTAVRSSLTISTATLCKLLDKSSAYETTLVAASMLQDASISFVRRAFAQC